MRSYDLKKAPVTIILAAANILVFFILSASGSTENNYFMYEHGAMLTEAIRQDGEIWRMFTCLFLHFGFMHLANNMLSLFIFGALMENGIGHLRVLLIYFAAGLGGNVISYFWDLHKGRNILSAGAPGAIFGLMGALVFCALFARDLVGSLSVFQIILLLALSLYHSAAESVDDAAHIGGLIIGFLTAAVSIWLFPPKRRKEVLAEFQAYLAAHPEFAEEDAPAADPADYTDPSDPNAMR